MDIFATTMTVVQEIYAITIFIKEVVDDVKSYDEDRGTIQQKLCHEFVFVDIFKDLFFDNECGMQMYKQQRKSLHEDIKTSLDRLREALAEYRYEAATHGILLYEEQTTAAKENTKDTDRSKKRQEQRTRIQKQVHGISRKAKDFKKKAFDWSLFDKARMNKMLKSYSEETQRLRQSMALMIDVSAVKGLLESTNKEGMNELGLSQVAKRRDLTNAEPDVSFPAREGKIVDGSEQAIARNLTTAKYKNNWSLTIKDVILEYRNYSIPLKVAMQHRSENIHDTASETQAAQKIQKLIDPVRNLAWLLHESSFPDCLSNATNCSVQSSSLLALNCLSYIDQPDKERFQFIYELPISGLSLQDKSTFRTLHSFINDPNSETPSSELSFLSLWSEYWSVGGQRSLERQKPSLGVRFFLSHAIATTVLNIHASGWVHKNLWSHGIIVCPTEVFPQDSQNACWIPFVAGWGIARPTSAKDTDMSEDHEPEANIYRHPDRQQRPSIKFKFIHDIYSVGVLLLEIGLWKTIGDIFRHQIEMANDTGRYPPGGMLRNAWKDSLEREVAGQMGNVYSQAVNRCLTGHFHSTSSDGKATELSIAFRDLVVDAVAEGLRL